MNLTHIATLKTPANALSANRHNGTTKRCINGHAKDIGVGPGLCFDLPAPVQHIGTRMPFPREIETERPKRARKIAIVAGYAPSLVNFRLELLKTLVGAGHTVEALAPEYDETVVRTLESLGITFRQIPMARTGMSPIEDIRTFLTLFKYFVTSRCDVVLPYTMKPVIYAGLAARLAGTTDRFALMTGLGYLFSDENPSWRKSMIRQLSVHLYRLALAGTKRVFVYNEADVADIKRHRMVKDEKLLTRVAGSGVDLDHFRQSDSPEAPVFLLVARLLRDKGVIEFAKAARILKARYPQAKFRLLGPFDDNPSGLSRAEVDGWVREGAIEYLGETRDVRPHLDRCSVFVLPSYYREGVPRSILEAMATGRAIVTTNLAGCRDTVVEGVNGKVIPPRDANALADAMERFIVAPELMRSMGRMSRKLAEERFDVRAVNRLLLTSMNLAQD